MEDGIPSYYTEFMNVYGVYICRKSYDSAMQRSIANPFATPPYARFGTYKLSVLLHPLREVFWKDRALVNTYGFLPSDSKITLDAASISRTLGWLPITYIGVYETIKAFLAHAFNIPFECQARVFSGREAEFAKQMGKHNFVPVLMEHFQRTCAYVRSDSYERALRDFRMQFDADSAVIDFKDRGLCLLKNADGTKSTATFFPYASDDEIRNDPSHVQRQRTEPLA